MLDVVTSKRELIERELQLDANRSDREIARVVGCDHKTVSAARAKPLPIPHGGESLAPETEPTPAQLRNLLLNAAEDFDAKYPPEPAEKVVDRVLAEKEARPATVDDNKFDWNDDDSIILKEQKAIAAYYNPAGGLVIRQKADWDEDRDTYVVITSTNCDAFIDRLTDIMGIPSFGGGS
jgi:hypothetical protein